MMKRAFSALGGVLGFCLPLLAQPTASLEQTATAGAATALALYPSDLFTSMDGALLMQELPLLGLLDGRRLPISSELGRMGTSALDFAPVAFVTTPSAQKLRTARSLDKEVVDNSEQLQLNSRYEIHGEVGVFYGKSTGRYGGEDFGSYVVGTIATDKVAVTAGASYEESTFHFPRRGR